MERETGRMLLLLVGKYRNEKFVILLKNLLYVFLVSDRQRDKERDWKDAVNGIPVTRVSMMAGGQITKKQTSSEHPTLRTSL